MVSINGESIKRDAEHFADILPAISRVIYWLINSPRILTIVFLWVVLFVAVKIGWKRILRLGNKKNPFDLIGVGLK